MHVTAAIRAACPTHLILLDLTTRIMFDEDRHDDDDDDDAPRRQFSVTFKY